MNALAESKIKQLRPIEDVCFRVAYYLLGDESEAAAAGKEALIELYLSPQFYAGTEDERRLLAKKAAARHALKRASGGAAERDQHLPGNSR
jgi:hypothetical protein